MLGFQDPHRGSWWITRLRVRRGARRVHRRRLRVVERCRLRLSPTRRHALRAGYRFCRVWHRCDGLTSVNEGASHLRGVCHKRGGSLWLHLIAAVRTCWYVPYTLLPGRLPARTGKCMFLRTTEHRSDTELFEIRRANPSPVRLVLLLPTLNSGVSTAASR